MCSCYLIAAILRIVFICFIQSFVRSFVGPFGRSVTFIDDDDIEFEIKGFPFSSKNLHIWFFKRLLFDDGVSSAPNIIIIIIIYVCAVVFKLLIRFSFSRWFATVFRFHSFLIRQFYTGGNTVSTKKRENGVEPFGWCFEHFFLNIILYVYEFIVDRIILFVSKSSIWMLVPFFEPSSHREKKKMEIGRAILLHCSWNIILDANILFAHLLSMNDAEERYIETIIIKTNQICISNMHLLTFLYCLFKYSRNILYFHWNLNGMEWNELIF